LSLYDTLSVLYVVKWEKWLLFLLVVVIHYCLNIVSWLHALHSVYVHAPIDP